MKKNKVLLIVIATIAAFLLISISLFSQNCIETTFLKEVGVVETGYNRGKKVEEYLNTAGAKPGNSWCSAFVYWVHKQCNPEFQLSAPAWSPTWFPTNKTIYNRTKDKEINALSGDVFGVYYPEKKRIAHVGFIYMVTDKYVITVEGNTSANQYSRDGDGVFQKIRPKRTIYKISRWR